MQDEQLDILKQYKRICFSGNTGTGKFQRALQLAHELTHHNKANIEIIAFHSNLLYEDFVYGTTIDTSGDTLSFREEQKRLLTIIDSANEKSEPFVIILKDLNQVNVYEVFGDVMPLLKGETKLRLNNGVEKTIPENLYVIATCNPLYAVSNSNASELHALLYTIAQTDLKIELQQETGVPEAFQVLKTMYEDVDYRIAYDHYVRVNQLITTYVLPEYEQDNHFTIGPYYFLHPNIAQKMNYQLVPLLEEYVKNGVLLKDALPEIASLVRHARFVNDYSKVPDFQLEDFTRSNAKGQKLGKRPFTDYFERLWNDAPLEHYSNPEAPHYLICQLLDVRLISVKEMMQEIMYTPTFYQYQAEHNAAAYFYLNLQHDMPHYKKVPKDVGGKITYQPIYRSKTGVLTINGIQYGSFKSHAYYNHVLKEFNNHLLDQNYLHTNHMNPTLFAILKRFYETYHVNLAQLTDDNSTQLKTYIEQCWQQFEQTLERFTKQQFIYPYNDKNLENRRQSYHFQFLKVIDEQLPFLKMTIGDEIELANGQKITLKGAYSVEPNQYIETMQQLNIRQMILQGPPGTSKTHSTNELLTSRIQQLKGTNDAAQLKAALAESQFKSELAEGAYPNGIAWSIVQFHPSYTYEDFIRGIRVETIDGQPSYQTVNKILGEMAQQAKGNPNTEYYLIVDEINRANLATVFGELIYGLEYRGNQVGTPYKVEETYTIELPENLYIIGTMNTADKSVGSIDYAIRRRFLFFDLLPNVDVIKNDTKQSIDANIPSPAVQLFEVITELFKHYTSKDYRQSDVQIGHTYFLTEKLVQKELQAKPVEQTAESVHALRKNILKSRFHYQIVPILREYLKDGILVDAKQNTSAHEAIDALFKLLKYDEAYNVDNVFTALLEAHIQKTGAAE